MWNLVVYVIFQLSFCNCGYQAKLTITPPSFDYTIGETKEYPIFVCMIDEYPSVSHKLSWKFRPYVLKTSDEVDLPDNTEVEKRNNTIENYSVSFLSLKNPNLNNNGTFFCHYEKLRVKAVLFVRRKKDHIYMRVKPLSQTYIIGKTKKDPEAHCAIEAKAGNASELLYWRFQPTQLTPERDLPKNAKALEIPSSIVVSSFLEIKNVAMDNNGHYNCHVRGNRRIKSTFTLIVRQEKKVLQTEAFTIGVTKKAKKFNR